MSDLPTPVATPAPAPAPAGSEPAVAFESVRKRFGTTVAVDHVTLTIPKGGVYGLIGPNGAGKTTSFAMACGWLSTDEGSIRVLGHAPGDVVSLKGRVGALPQDAALPPNDSVLDAMTFWARLAGRDRRTAREGAAGALERVGMAEWGRVRCGALSHGMAKRVGLAQAFLGDPELVLLDEPTAGLDPKSAFQLREFVKQQRREGHTIVISSHNLHELEELCDAAAILDRGRLVTAGTMEELTRAVAEIRVTITSPAPLEGLRALPCASSVSFDEPRRQLVVVFSPGKFEGEDVIAEVLKLLLSRNVRISAVSRGRKLEERVMELT